MPALDDSASIDPIGPLVGVRARPVNPSPRYDGLRLEVISVKQAGYLGHIFGVDTPLYEVPMGWGEWAADVNGE
jgi:hypothetical protein